MGFVALVIIGAAAGFIATRLLDMDTPILPTILVGMAGAIVGGLILRFILVVGGMLAGLVGAVLGAMALLWLWKMWQSR